MTDCCPCCGAEQIDVRGTWIWFPRKKADIMRRVVRPGAVVFAQDFDTNFRNFNVSVYTINEFYLTETDYRVKGTGPRGSNGSGGFHLINVNDIKPFKRKHHKKMQT